MSRTAFCSAAIIATSGVLSVTGLILSAAPACEPSVTFTKDIAPILYRDCAGCHRPGEIAPMSLINYADTRPWARSIKANVATGLMLPWHAQAPRGTFENDRRLTAAEKTLITRRVEAGSPEGDPKASISVPSTVPRHLAA